MDKLELKHIAGYLEHNLRSEILGYKCDYVGKRYDEIIGVHQWSGCGKLWSALTKGGAKPSIDQIKPILHPLSDLTEEFANLCNYSHKDFKWAIINKEVSISIWNELLSKHYDVDDLIGKGLAISINDIKQ